MAMLLLGMCACWVTEAAHNFQYKHTPLSFDVWREQNGVEYSSFTEMGHRFTTWSLNLKKVISHNARADRGEVSFRLAMNRFADLTVEE